MASAPAFALILLSLPFLAAAESPAAAPTVSPPAAPTISPTPPVDADPVAILKKDGRFLTLLSLLTKYDLVPAISERLSDTGITIFAPTDNAFKKIAADLKKLSDASVTTILKYHALYNYETLDNLDPADNPFDTLAQDLTLNFTGEKGQVNVTTGVVNTKVGASLYDQSPLGLFPVEDVLIPPTSTPPPAPGPAKAKTPTSTPALPPSAATLQRVGWGALVGAALACLSFY